MESRSVKPPKTLINTVRLLLPNDVDRLKRSLGDQDLGQYLNSHRHWPPDRLKIFFGQSEPGQETPFAELVGKIKKNLRSFQ
jgi:hypothetical protein